MELTLSKDLKFHGHSCVWPCDAQNIRDRPGTVEAVEKLPLQVAGSGVCTTVSLAGLLFSKNLKHSPPAVAASSGEDVTLSSLGEDFTSA
jgi:hypothetical protein